MSDENPSILFQRLQSNSSTIRALNSCFNALIAFNSPTGNPSSSQNIIFHDFHEFHDFFMYFNGFLCNFFPCLKKAQGENFYIFLHFKRN